MRCESVRWELLANSASGFFLRHVSAESVMATLEESIPFPDRIVAVGFDSSELGWKPLTTFEEGFSRTVRWLTENPDRLERYRARAASNLSRFSQSLR